VTEVIPSQVESPLSSHGSKYSLKHRQQLIRNIKQYTDSKIKEELSLKQDQPKELKIPDTAREERPVVARKVNSNSVPRCNLLSLRLLR